MGILDGRSASYDGRKGPYEIRRKSNSFHGGSVRGHSPARSVASSKGYFVRPAASARSSSSFFGMGGGSRGLFGSGSSSYYRRSPRSGYVSYLWHKLQRMFRELWHYARRHPMKAFFAVVVPLLSAGGAIHGIMRQFGIRIPGMEGAARTMRGGYYGSKGYGSDRGGGWMDNAGSLMSIAKAFI